VVDAMSQTKSRPATATNETVKYLRQTIGLAERDLATATGASTRTVRRWLHADVEHAHQRHVRRIDELNVVVRALEVDMTRAWIRLWLRSNRHLPELDGSSPLNCLGIGGFESVLRAARSVRVDPSVESWMLRPAAVSTPSGPPTSSSTPEMSFAEELAALDIIVLDPDEL
jgi:hypothetical protein